MRLLTQSLALELAPAGIRVNAVAPAYVESAMVTESLRLEAEQAGVNIEALRQRRDAAIPLGRQATAREVGNAYLYLGSEAAAYITGSALDINGGVVLR